MVGCIISKIAVKEKSMVSKITFIGNSMVSKMAKVGMCMVSEKSNMEGLLYLRKPLTVGLWF